MRRKKIDNYAPSMRFCSCGSFAAQTPGCLSVHRWSTVASASYCGPISQKKRDCSPQFISIANAKSHSFATILLLDSFLSKKLCVSVFLVSKCIVLRCVVRFAPLRAPYIQTGIYCLCCYRVSSLRRML